MQSATLAAPAVHWQVEGIPVAVDISAEALDQLQSAFAHSGEGEEFGGLLLGSMDEYHTRVEALEPFSFEHRHHQLEQRLKRRSRRGLTPIGLYRSHERRGLYLDQRDFDLFKEFFHNPAAVFLLARRDRGGIFVWEGDDVRRHESYQEFPLDAPVPAPVEQPRPRREIPWLLLAALALPVAAFLIARSLPHHHDPQPQPPPTVVVTPPAPVPLKEEPFHFASRQVGKNVELSWDTQSPEVRRSDHGHLTIGDGAFQVQLGLTRKDLDSGRYLYTPDSSTVTAQMDLFSRVDGQTASTRLRATTSVTLGRRTAVVPPPAASRTIAPAPALPPPEFSAEAPSAPALPDLLSPRIAPPQRPDVNGGVVSAFIKPAPPSLAKQALQKIPWLRSEAFVPPNPVAHPMPPAPRDLAGQGEADVELRAKISRRGRVTDLRVVRGDWRLAKLSGDALYRWRFEPARENGNPVDSELLVRFVFRNPGR